MYARYAQTAPCQLQQGSVSRQLDPVPSATRRRTPRAMTGGQSSRTKIEVEARKDRGRSPLLRLRSITTAHDAATTPNSPAHQPPAELHHTRITKTRTAPPKASSAAS